MNGHDIIAYVGQYKNEGLILSSYEDAVQEMFKLLESGQVSADRIAFPLLFLMRHTLELGYKYSISHLSGQNQTSFKPNDRAYSHKLEALHQRLMEEFTLCCSNRYVSKELEEQFNSYADHARGIMDQFVLLDKAGTAFRYWDNAKFLDPINLSELKRNFLEAMVLLNHTPSVFDDPRP